MTASRLGRAFTLIEMMTTIAVLIIVFGLMISLARDVRNRSATLLTTELLARLDAAMGRYIDANTGHLPEVPLLLSGPTAPDAELHRQATRNNAAVIRALRAREDLSASVLHDLPISIYDERTVRDAWGNPIVFMPAMHPAIGMAAGNHSFFFSPGPDGKYLTRDDNLYSYETAGSGEVGVIRR
jgi:type II secretory pathway pseudopilin PulG